MSKLKMHSPNLVDSNIEKIAELFPNCITEIRSEDGELSKGVDFDLLRQELSEVLVDGPQERYRLDWPGKKEAILTANAPIAKTLRPCREESVNFDTTENLFIEGDNLDALKLLQENYLGKVKMIYIDPPYNTGNDFIYEDDFAESTDEFLVQSTQRDEEGNRLVANLESNGRFHSDWLSMIYSRLKLARNLLSDDGVIFISIDDNEQANLKKICDEVFGENNFISSLVWDLGTGTQAGHFVRGHENVLVYFKNKFLVSNFIGGEGVIEHSALKKISYKNPASDFEFPAGTQWDAEDGTQLVGNWGGSESMMLISGRMIAKDNKLVEPVKLRAGYAQRSQMETWFKGEETFDTKGQRVIGFYFNSSGILRYKKERTVLNPSTVLGGLASTKTGSTELLEIFGDKLFDYPKPSKLIGFFVKLVSSEQDIILDFFAGSSTTAHAVMQQNTEDGGNRKFIMVQLPEKTAENSEAHRAGYSTIAEISKERIRRAGAKILADNVDKEGIENLDIGFRVLKVDSSNMKDVYYKPELLEQADLLDLADNIKDDRSAEDLLFQVMVDEGIELSLPIECKEILGQSVYYVAGNSLVACFDSLSLALVDEVAKDQPLLFVSAERSIQADQDKRNIKERFKQLSSKTDVKFF